MPIAKTGPVLIAGGGIGGMALALTLHQIGVPCLVLESVHELQPLGVGIKLGPGELVGEFAFEWGKLDWVATGDSNSMGGNLNVGYRFLL